MTRTLLVALAVLGAGPASAQFALHVQTDTNGAGRAVAVAPNGDLFLGGQYSHGAFIASDFDPGPGVVSGPDGTGPFVARYTEAGALDWVWAVNESTGRPSVLDVAARSDGGVVAAGGAFGTFDADPGPGSVPISAGRGLFVMSLDAAGAVEWAFATPRGNSDVIASAVAVGTDGAIYVTGEMTGSQQDGAVDFDPGPGEAILTNDRIRAFVASYTAQGAFRWAFTIGGDGKVVRGRGVAVDADGVYVTGMFTGTNDFDPGAGVSSLTPAGGSSWDGYVASYALDGQFNWAGQFGTANALDEPWAIAADGSGGAFVVGSLATREPDRARPVYFGRAYLGRFRSGGDLLWSVAVGEQWQSGANAGNAAYAVAATRDRVAMGGHFVRQFDADPGPDQTVLTQPADSYQQGFAAVYDADTGAFIAADAIGDLGDEDFEWVRGLAWHPTGLAVAGTTAGTTTFPEGTTLTLTRDDPFLTLYDPNPPGPLSLLVQERVSVTDTVELLEALALLVRERIVVTDDATFLEALARLVQERIGVTDEVNLLRSLQLLVREAIGARDDLGLESESLAFGTRFVSVPGLLQFGGGVGLGLNLAGVEGMGEVTVLRQIGGGTQRRSDALDDRWVLMVEETVTFSAESSVVIDLAATGAPTDPTTVAIAFRPTGAADFVTLPTLYDTEVGTLTATGLTGSGEIEVVANPVAREALPEVTALWPLFPNPASGPATVRFDLAEPDDVRITVYDALGREVAALHDGPMDAGAHRATLATGRLAPGLYVVRMTVGETVATQTLTVLR